MRNPRITQAYNNAVRRVVQFCGAGILITFLLTLTSKNLPTDGNRYHSLPLQKTEATEKTEYPVTEIEIEQVETPANNPPPTTQQCQAPDVTVTKNPKEKYVLGGHGLYCASAGEVARFWVFANDGHNAHEFYVSLRGPSIQLARIESATQHNYTFVYMLSELGTYDILVNLDFRDSVELSDPRKPVGLHNMQYEMYHGKLVVNGKGADSHSISTVSPWQNLPLCQTGDAGPGRWLACVGECVEANSGQSIMWMPYACRYRFFNTTTMNECAERKKILKVLIVGDSHSRVRFNMMVQLFHGNTDGLPKGHTHNSMEHSDNKTWVGFGWRPALGKFGTETTVKVDKLIVNHGQHDIAYGSMDAYEKKLPNIAKHYENYIDHKNIIWAETPAWIRQTRQHIAHKYGDHRSVARCRRANELANPIMKAKGYQIDSFFQITEPVIHTMLNPVDPHYGRFDKVKQKWEGDAGLMDVQILANMFCNV